MSKKLNLGVTDLSFHRITGALVTHLLESMGFEVTTVYSKHEENFNKLQSAEIDALCSAWLPSRHGLYKQNVEQQKPLIELGLHYAPYALWGVPDYVPAEEVASVQDLLKQNVVNKMTSVIQGINPDAGITRFSQEIMKQYHLAEAGYEFFTGEEEDCFSAFEKAVLNNQWVVVPLWKPQFLHHKYNIRELHEPKGLLGTTDRAVLLLPEEKREWFSAIELQQLDGLKFSNKVIAELDYQVCRENKPLEEVAQHWWS